MNEQNNDWQDNTTQRPFWIDSIQGLNSPTIAVEVLMKDGKIHHLPCPKCARSLFGLVQKWRRIKK